MNNRIKWRLCMSMYWEIRYCCVLGDKGIAVYRGLIIRFDKRIQFEDCNRK